MINEFEIVLNKINTYEEGDKVQLSVAITLSFWSINPLILVHDILDL